MEGYIYVDAYSTKVQKYPSGAINEKLFSPNSFLSICVTSVASLLLTRQVLFERHDYTRPNSGIINQDSHFKASEFVHAGLIVDCKHEQLDFYDQVLGLRRIVDNRESKYGEASRLILELKGPENRERMLSYYFTAPLTSTTDKPEIRSGNLEVLRFEGSLPNKLAYSRPGSLGVCLYTMKVKDIQLYYQRVSSSEATEVTQVYENEFDEKSLKRWTGVRV